MLALLTSAFEVFVPYLELKITSPQLLLEMSKLLSVKASTRFNLSSIPSHRLLPRDEQETEGHQMLLSSWSLGGLALEKTAEQTIQNHRSWFNILCLEV